MSETIKTIWGFDLGTNSLGWSVISKQGEAEAAKITIKGMGVLLFHDSRLAEREGLLGDSLATVRRMARGMRKNRDHKLVRVKGLAKAIKLTLSLGDEAIDNQINPYWARAQAASGYVADKTILARALLHLGKRRGYKSNSKSGKKEAGTYKKHFDALQAVLDGDKITLGQFLYRLNQQQTPLRFRLQSNKELQDENEIQYYPLRAHYEQEFEQIKSHNQAWFPEEIWQKLRTLIVNQRPLRSQQDKRKKCLINKDELCASKHLMAYQWFRLKQELDNLAFLGNRQQITLTHQQKLEFMGSEKAKQKEIKFTELAKIFGYKGWDCNLARNGKTGLQGLTTLAHLEKFLGADLEGITSHELDRLLAIALETEEDSEFIIEASSLFPNQAPEVWQTFKDFADDLPTGKYASFCLGVIEQLNERMKEGENYHEAMLALGHHHSDHYNTGEVS